MRRYQLMKHQWNLPYSLYGSLTVTSCLHAQRTLILRENTAVPEQAWQKWVGLQPRDLGQIGEMWRGLEKYGMQNSVLTYSCAYVKKEGAKKTWPSTPSFNS